MSRGITFTSTFEFIVETCCHDACGIAFAMTTDMQRRRFNDRRTFYCPNGHAQRYTGPSDEQKLKDEQARNTHLRDQLRAAAESAEKARRALIKDRHRFANGVCPCCNRYFDNVRRHMAGQHPDYDLTKVEQEAAQRFSCSCGRTFNTPHGLHTHQGRLRTDDWTSTTSQWHGGHTTEVTR